MANYHDIAEIKRSDFIIECWKRDFPKVSDLEWSSIAKLISRSEALQDWYFKRLSEMKILVEMPRWARNVMATTEFDKVRNDIGNYSQALSQLSRDIALQAMKRNAEVKKLRDDFDVKWKTTISNPLVFIFSLNTSKLPIKILMEIENYEQRHDKQMTKAQFAAEKLDSFKQHLYTMHLDGVDVFKYCEDEALKF